MASSNSRTALWVALMRERHDIRSRSFGFQTLEEEYLEENVFHLCVSFLLQVSQLISIQRLLRPVSAGYSPEDAANYTTEQLTVWEKPLGPKIHRRTQALTLVLKYKAETHARREVRVAGAMRRLTDPAFPAELRLIIIEATVEPRTMYWKKPMLRGLDWLTENFFVWPHGVEDFTRSMLRQTVADVLSKAFLVKMPMEYLLKRRAFLNTLHAPAVPPALHGIANNIRRLVLDHRVSLSVDGPWCLNLDEGIDGMKLMETIFPNLDVCIFLLKIETWHRTLRDRDVAAICKFIAAFLDHGLGRRKLIRLSQRTVSQGPLVELSSHNPRVLKCGNSQVGDSGTGEQSSIDYAERIFRQAHPYWRPQG